MSHHIIPAPLRFEGGGSKFWLLRSARVGYTAGDLEPMVVRFCAEVARRMGVDLAVGDPDEASIRIELGPADDLRALPAPQGVSPAGPVDERHSLTIDGERALLRAVEPAGVARGLTTLVQLLATGAETGRILDAPRYAWRGLSLDVARRFFTLDELRRVIDLLALYKLNVLHLHLTDDQGWRLPVPRPDSAFYAAEDLRALVAYAEERFVAIVPEVDTPGHASALVDMRPELNSGRNLQRAVWLDPELPATFEVIEEVLGAVADIFPSPYIHIGGDEPYGMPDDLYGSYVRRVRELVRSLGKRPLGWQESARAGLRPDDMIQYWFTDAETAAAAAVPIIVSPQSNCYLDVPYADTPADPAQAERHGRLGLRVYAPRTVEASFAWEPAETLGTKRVAGVEAAIWAETISDFDDLSFLLLPRLPGVAQKAWGDRHTTWQDHRTSLARHGRLWDQDGLTYFRAATIVGG